MKKILVCMMLGLLAFGCSCKGSVDKLPTYKEEVSAPVVTASPDADNQVAQGGSDATDATDSVGTGEETTAPTPTPEGTDVEPTEGPDGEVVVDGGDGQGNGEVVTNPSDGNVGDGDVVSTPTATPEVKPTAKPTTAPEVKPTAKPTAAPTTAPTAAPTAKPGTSDGGTTPVATPTPAPTTAPTQAPSVTGCTDHDYVVTKTISEATCKKAKVVEEKCSKCGDTKTCEEGLPIEHDFQGYTVWVQPTCARIGEGGGTCSMCGGTEWRPISKTAHDYEATVLTEGDCQSEHVVRYDCKNCNDFYVERSREYHANDHVWITKTVKRFDEDAWEWYEVEITKCSVCNEYKE